MITLPRADQKEIIEEEEVEYKSKSRYSYIWRYLTSDYQ